MPIAFAQYDAQVDARLDAEGSDHYRDVQDKIPAANAAQDFIITTVNRVLGRKKYSEKILSELMFTRIWQTSLFGRVYLNEAQLNAAGQGPIWDIVACHAEPTTIPAAPGITAIADELSLLRSQVSFRSSMFPCKRLTHEQYADTERNPLLGGSEFMSTSDLRSYYYMVHSYMRTSPDYETQGWELQFGPLSLTGKKLVAITHLKTPRKITTIADTIEFPPMCLEILVSRALHYISIKQGDGSSLYRTQAEDTELLMQMLT